MNYKLQILFLCFFLGKSLSAQVDLSTYFLNGTPQAYTTNPSFALDEKLTISLPGVYYNFYHSLGAYDDFIRKEGNRTILDATLLAQNASTRNDFQSQLDIETLGVYWKKKQLQLGFAHRIRSFVNAQYSDKLVDLLALGNAPFIGQTIQLNPQLNLFSYNEYAFSTAYQWDNLRLGVRAKLLAGIGSIHTAQNDISIQTSNDIYQLSLQTNYQLLSNELLRINGFRDFAIQTDAFGNNFFSSNLGFALDVGLQYEINEKWRVSASAVDIGQLNWKDDITAYHSEGAYTYEGIDLADFISQDDVNIAINLDTLEQIFQFNTTSTDAKFGTYLPLKLYLGTAYQLSDQWQLGALYHLERSPFSLRHSIAINAQWQPLEWVSLGVLYSNRYQMSNQIGLHTTINLGPVQLIGSTDGIFSVLSPTKNKVFNARLGANLVF